LVVTLGAYAHCQVDATETPINVGDLLTTSANPGHARKAVAPQIGSIIGKALEPLGQGTGCIAVFVNNNKGGTYACSRFSDTISQPTRGGNAEMVPPEVLQGLSYHAGFYLIDVPLVVIPVPSRRPLQEGSMYGSR
jgi:hypothetical protein